MEYSKFLVLKSIEPDRIVPSFLILQLWKEHFTHTRHYRNMCSNVFGQHTFIHYSAFDKETFESNYEFTINLYTDTFSHNPLLEVWKNFEEEDKLMK
jgi:hypothetical protein